MKIVSAKFLKGVVGDDKTLRGYNPQVAFIGRSNAGKSSLLNTLVGSAKLAVTSSTPGRTRQLNVFLINETHLFVDLPGYGYAKANFATRDKLNELINWYLFESGYKTKVVLLVDALVGPTVDDLEVLHELERVGKEIVVVLNKVDKLKKAQYTNQLAKLNQQFAGHIVIPFSSKTKVGIIELTREIMK